MELDEGLTLPAGASAVVVFVHGSGSSRHSPRNRFVASVLNEAGLGTLLFDLLTPDEEADRANVFDIALLADRLTEATAWLRTRHSGPVGWFGASTGAGAALWAAAEPDADVAAIVSRGGRPDLAGDRLPAVRAPTLLIVGGLDPQVLELNRQAQARLRCPNELRVIEGATHLFEEGDTLAQAAGLARDWFVARLAKGFRLLPHTADLRVEAWAPTVEGCLAAAAEGLVASFADIGGASPQGTADFSFVAAPDPELLVELLDEVVYLVDAEDLVPVRVQVARDGDGGLRGEFAVVPRSAVPSIGPAPKAVTRHGLRVQSDNGVWRCQVVVDV